MLNKKGDISDAFIVLISIFFLAVSFIVVAYVNSKFGYVVRSTVLNQSDAAGTIANSIDLVTTHTIQNGFTMIFAIFIIGMLVSSFLVRVHPAWLFLYIITTIIAIFLAILLTNVYQSIITGNALSSIAAQQTMITWIMQHSVKLLIGAIGLSLIILFSKSPDSTPL